MCGVGLVQDGLGNELYVKSIKHVLSNFITSFLTHSRVVVSTPLFKRPLVMMIKVQGVCSESHIRRAVRSIRSVICYNRFIG